MCTIKISELLKNRTFPEAGDALYKLIIKEIEQSDKIILNLENVDALPSMFLNTSIGKFIEEYGVDLLKQKISFSNIRVSQAQRIKEYIIKFNDNK